MDSGYFDVKAKLRSSVRDNLLFYAVVGGVGVVGFLFLLISGRLDLASLPALCIGASNAFGENEDENDLPPGIIIAVKARKASMATGYGAGATIPARYLPAVQPAFRGTEDDAQSGATRWRWRRPPASANATSPRA